MFFSSTPRLPCKERTKDVDGNFNFFCSRHHCLVQCVLQFECEDCETRCLSLFSSRSLSTGSLVLFERPRVGGWRLLRLLWKTWMWAQLSLRLLEQLCDHSGFSVTNWGLIVSQKVRQSLLWMIDWHLELLSSVSFGIPCAVDYSWHFFSKSVREQFKHGHTWNMTVYLIIKCGYNHSNIFETIWPSA